MRLGLIVNCVGYDKNSAKLNIYLLKNIFPKLEQLGIDVNFVMPSSDWIRTKITKHTDFLPSQDPTTVITILKSLNNKGIIVRGCAADFIRDGCDCILHIDGSGRFNLDDINRVSEMALDGSVDAILTIRDKSGMNKFRTMVEKIETQLVLQKHPKANIEDGQCGCWCVKLDSDGYDLEKELTATGYEIELNILISQLQHERNIVWLPVRLTDEKKSNFEFGANIVKMAWLSKKLKIKKEKILDLLQRFQEINKVEIEEAEKESFELGDKENTFDNYVQRIKESDGFIG